MWRILNDRVRLASVGNLRPRTFAICRFIVACVVCSYLSTNSTGQVAWDFTGADANCEGCRNFLSECDALPSRMPPFPDVPKTDGLPPVVQPFDRSSVPTESGDASLPDRSGQDSIAAPPVPNDFDVNGANTASTRPLTAPPNSLASTLGATSGSSGIPSMIGDFFGNPTSAISTSTRIAGSPLDVVTTFPVPGAGLPWAVRNGYVASGSTGPPAFFIANDAGDFFANGGDVTGFDNGPVNFTTAVTAAEAIAMYNNRGGALRIPIVDDSQTNEFVQQQAESLYGHGGSLVFLPSESGILAFEVGSTRPPVSGGEFALPNPVYVYDYVLPIAFVPAPSAGGSVGRVRLSDNNSALPQNRLFFDYHYFKSVPLTDSGVDVNRFTPGFERKFLGGNASVELRVPLAVTLDSNLTTDGATELTNGELGNVSVAAKFLLLKNATSTVAAGIGISLPTADEINVGLVDGTRLARIENEAVHLTPYFAALIQPSRNHFFHAFLQFDIDTGGDTVYTNPTLTGLSRAGVWNDQTYLFADVGAGKWIARNDSLCRGLSGVALTAEVHYTNAISSADFIRTGGIVVGNPDADLDMLNGTVGAHFRWRQNLITTAGYSFPFTSDRVFDGEFRLFANRYF